MTSFHVGEPPGWIAATFVSHTFSGPIANAFDFVGAGARKENVACRALLSGREQSANIQG